MEVKKNRNNLRLDLITSKNVNISEPSDIKSFFEIVLKVVIVLYVIFLLFGLIANIVVDNISTQTQLRIEKVLNLTVRKNNLNDKYPRELKKLERIKREIMKRDDTLKGKSTLPIYIKPNSTVNAFLMPNGSIFVTEGILKRKYSDEELTFILAHEIGHYSNKDHIHTLCKKFMFKMMCLIFSNNNDEVTKVFEKARNIENLKYSKFRESKADKYAGEMLIKIYGSTKGGVMLLKDLKKNSLVPEFAYVFLDHPSNNVRIKKLQKLEKRIKKGS